jgi:hypothetical protein
MLALKRMAILASLVLSSASYCPPPPFEPDATFLGYNIDLENPRPPKTAPVGTAIPVTFSAWEEWSDGSTGPLAFETLPVSVMAGGGTVNGVTDASPETNMFGEVTVTWILGPVVGVQTIRAHLGSSYCDVSVTAIPRA